MTVNKIVWLVCIGDNHYSSQTVELPFTSKGKDNMKQAEDELEVYMTEKYPGKNYSIVYWDWIDPDNKMIQCAVCDTWYGSVWDKKGGCPTCQGNKAREERKRQQKEWELQERERNKKKKVYWWAVRKNSV